MDALLRAAFLDAGLRLGVKAGGGAADLALLVMDELAYGVMVVTLDGRMVYSNQAARAGLLRSGVAWGATDDLSDSVPEGAKSLYEALGKAADGKRSLVTFSGQSESLTLAVVPFRGEPGAPSRAVLIFSRTAVHESLILGLYARSHGLTATEEHVLGILCQGYSTPEIAAQMKVAVSTIRSHVRSMCGKTGSSGVRELVNRVAVLPPVAPAPPQGRFH